MVKSGIVPNVNVSAIKHAVLRKSRILRIAVVSALISDFVLLAIYGMTIYVIVSATEHALILKP